MDKLFTYIRVKRTHLHVGVSHSCKLVCNSVHVPAQAMNSINPGVKWWKEPALIAFFGQLPGVVLYAIFVGFHNTYAVDFGTFVTFHGGTPGMSENLRSRQASDAHCPSTAASLPAPSAPIKHDG